MASYDQIERLARMIYESGREFGPENGFSANVVPFDEVPSNLWALSMQVSSHILDHLGDVLIGTGR